MFKASVVAMLLFSGGSAHAQSSSCSASDEAGVRQLVKDFDAAATTHDPAKYAAMFAEDADWENAFGDRRKGRNEIRDGMGSVMKTFSTAQEKITDVKVHCLAPQLALVDIYQTITGQKTPKGVEVPTRHIRMTQLHEKRDGSWVIRVHRVADLRGQNKQG